MNSEPATPRLAWSLLQPDWLEVCKAARQPAFRARQIWKWLYQERVDNWESMTNLPAAWRKELAVSHPLTPWAAEERQVADDGVTKLLLTCRDGQAIETVLIPADERLTLCVSTQAGCAFGCAFCATGRGGYVRDLDAGEIVGQYMAASRAAAPRRITNLVVMGMGEPFANYDATLRAVRIFNDYDGIGIGARRITLSTCGVIPGIQRLAEENLQVELSVSLHAATDELRSAIMPVNRRWPLKDLLSACQADRPDTPEAGAQPAPATADPERANDGAVVAAYACEGGNTVELVREGRVARASLSDGRTIRLGEMAGSTPPTWSDVGLRFVVDGDFIELAQTNGEYSLSCSPM